MPKGTWAANFSDVGSDRTIHPGFERDPPDQAALSSTTTAVRAVRSGADEPSLFHGRRGDDDRRFGQILDFDPDDGQASDASVRPHEVGHERRLRASEDLGRGVVLLEDASFGEHGDPVTELRRLLDVVGDEDDRLLELLLQVEELVLESLAGDGIHGGEGLVHEQDRGVGSEGSGHPDPLALAPRRARGESGGRRL